MPTAQSQTGEQPSSSPKSDDWPDMWSQLDADGNFPPSSWRDQNETNTTEAWDGGEEMLTMTRNMEDATLGSVDEQHSEIAKVGTNYERKNSNGWKPSDSLPSNCTNSSAYFKRHCKVQESFATYELKIVALCEALGFSSPSVEHMRGGGYNRVASIDVSASDVSPSTAPQQDGESSAVRKYVLRTPREWTKDSDENIKNHVAVLHHLGKYLPVPKVIAYGVLPKDSEVQVGITRYVFLERVQGGQLWKVYPGLSMEEKKQVVDLVVDLIVKMENVKFDRYFGDLVGASEMPDRCDRFESFQHGKKLIRIAPHKVHGVEVRKKSFKDCLEAMLDLQEERLRGKQTKKKWRNVMSIFWAMKGKGLLDDDSSVLWHWDFHGRNILVDKKDGKWEVTALIDFDDAVAAPKVIARSDQIWLWNWDWGTDADTLTDDEKAIKQYFMEKVEAALPGFCKDAFKRGPCVRQMLMFASEGLDHHGYARFMDDWCSLQST